MGKHKSSLQTHHLYLSVGGLVAVTALILALTFGLSSAQSGMTCMDSAGNSVGQCADGTCSCYGPPPGGTDPCPVDACPNICCAPPTTCQPPPAGCGTGQWWDAGMCMCKSSDSGTTDPCPGDSCLGVCCAGTGCTAPLNGCPTGSTWNQATCTCQGGTPPPGGCTDPMPSTPCSVSNNHYECQNSAWTCVPNTMPGGMTCTAAGGDCCLAGSTSDPDCLGGPTGGCTSAMPTTTPCGQGQHYECQNSAWTCKADMAPPVNTVQCTPPMQPFSGPSGQMSCYDPATLSTCSSTVFPPCKPQGWVAPPSTGNCTGTPPPCVTDSHFECIGTAYQCVKNQTMPTCAPGQQPTMQVPCKLDTQLIDPAMSSCTAGGGVWCPNTSGTGGWCKSTAGPCTTVSPTTQTCTGAAASCSSGYHSECTGTKYECVKNYYKPSLEEPKPEEYYKPNECPPDMQKCPDQWNPENTVCMPKKMFWDMKTGKEIKEGKDATCADFQASPSAMGMDKMNFFEEKGPGKDQDPCKMNPDELFCKAGYDFKKMMGEYEFDESQFMPREGKMNASDIKREVRNFKMEAKGWANDAKQIRRQLKEIGRESSGIACPAAVEVSAIVQQLEDAAIKASALSDKSSQEEVQTAMSLRDFVNGTWQDGEQVTEGLRQKLFGGPPNEDGERIPGKMETLNICRELSNVINEAKSLVKEVSRELERAQKSGAPAEMTKVFEEVLAELREIATDPVGVLQKKGVSLEEVSKPWQPDPEICGEFMYGPGPGGPGGPMPMQFEQMMGPGGGQGFGPMEGFDSAMMEKMKGKFMEMQKGEGNFQNFQGFNPSGASVLSAQADGEDFGFEGPQFGPPEGKPDFGQEPPEECMPPIQRYLSPHRLMRKLDELRFNITKNLEFDNVCNMLGMAQDFLESEEGQGPNGPPPEVTDLVKSGVWQEACDDNDTDTLAKIKERLMRLGPPGGPGKQTKRSFGGLIDIDKMVEDKLNEKLGQLFEEDENISSKQMKALEARVLDLQKKLDEATLTILALNEQVSEMATRLATAVNLDERATTAIGSIANLPDEVVQTAVTNSMTTLAIRVEEAKRVLSVEGDRLVDATMNSLLTSPPSRDTVEDISDRFNAVISYASSGAKPAEILERVKDEVAEVAVLNRADVGNKVTEGIIASRDTGDLSQWYAVPVLEAKEGGFVSITAENPDFRPGEPESKCAAITRVARIMEKAGEIEEINLDDRAPVAGAPEWCRPFVHALQEEEVPFVQDLTDPNATADRLDVAMLMHQAIGDRLPDPPNVEQFLTPDVRNLPVDQQLAIAEVRFNRIMDTTDGTNFSPRDDFNRAQNALVTVRAHEAVQQAAEEEQPPIE